MIDKLNAEIILIDNQTKFINLIKTNTKIFNLEENELIKILSQNKLKKYNDSYDYLINMSFKQLSYNNLTKLTNKVKELKESKKIIENKTTENELLKMATPNHTNYTIVEAVINPKQISQIPTEFLHCKPLQNSGDFITFGFITDCP